MAEEDSVYAEVTPVPENDLEIMKLILVPYQGTIVRHYPERNCVLVELPDLSALDALQQVPSYTTVMVDPPAKKQPHASAAGDAEEKARSGDPAAVAANEASSTGTARGGGVGGAAGETLQQRGERQQQEGPTEPLHLPMAQEGLTYRKSAVAAAAGASDPKQQAPAHGVTTRPSFGEKGFAKKRKPLPANDIIYLFGDINIVAPAWCLFLVIYAIATLFGAV